MRFKEWECDTITTRHANAFAALATASGLNEKLCETREIQHSITIQLYDENWVSGTCCDNFIT